MYGQIWYKDGGNTRRTPWYQDILYQPAEGHDIGVLWTNLDPVTRDTSLKFVQGSHRRPVFNPTAFSPDDVKTVCSTKEYCLQCRQSCGESLDRSLQHERRNTDGCQVTPHLLMPDKVIDVLIDVLERGDFYIICPNDDVTPEMDRKRILWAACDLADNRLALLGLHPDYASAFEKFSA